MRSAFYSTAFFDTTRSYYLQSRVCNHPKSSHNSENPDNIQQDRAPPLPRIRKDGVWTLLRNHSNGLPENHGSCHVTPTLSPQLFDDEVVVVKRILVQENPEGEVKN